MPLSDAVLRRRGRTERGSGLLGAVLGVGMLLTLLGLASNVTIGLWTRSTVDSIAYDVARQVATAPANSDPSATRTNAVAEAQELLGRYGQRVQLRFEDAPTDDAVVLHVRAPGVSPLPRLLGGGPTVGALDRRIVMVKETPG